MSGIKDPTIKVKYNVKVAKRKFIPDTNGSVISHDGRRGSYSPWNIQNVHNLLTDAGRDFLHQQGYFTTGLGANGGNYIALTTNTAAPADGDTTLTGEITDGGLGRAQGTLSHSAGENTSTVVNTFTASATHTSVQKSALFTASSAGSMVHEATFTAVTLESADQLQISWTITIDD